MRNPRLLKIARRNGRWNACIIKPATVTLEKYCGGDVYHSHGDAVIDWELALKLIGQGVEA